MCVLKNIKRKKTKKTKKEARLTITTLFFLFERELFFYHAYLFVFDKKKKIEFEIYKTTNH